MILNEQKKTAVLIVLQMGNGIVFKNGRSDEWILEGEPNLNSLNIRDPAKEVVGCYPLTQDGVDRALEYVEMEQEAYLRWQEERER